MKAIKFSHKFIKMRGKPEYVTLLDVFTRKAEDMGTEFIRYETSYVGKKNIIQHSPIWVGDNIVLLLITDEGIMFTHCRPNTMKRYGFYRQRRGERFQVKVK